MDKTLHIITQCTDRKSLPVPTGFRLRAFKKREASLRACAWFEALAGGSSLRTARELYAGEHWSAIQEVERTAQSRGFRTCLWVVSAGHGLVNAEELLPPYSATFAANVPDTVVLDGKHPARDRQAWWRAIQSERPKKRRNSLANLAVDSTSSKFILIMSRPYLQAILPDIHEARSLIGKPKRLAIVTGEAAELATEDLALNWVPSVAKLQAIVGGSRIGQHARVAEQLLRQCSPDDFHVSRFRDRVEKWMRETPDLSLPVREASSDRDVVSFINTSGTTSWSRALREFRDSGKACEQKRFRALFAETREQ